MVLVSLYTLSGERVLVKGRKKITDACEMKEHQNAPVTLKSTLATAYQVLLALHAFRSMAIA